MKPLMKDEDYYVLPDGRYVMTAVYLLKRGFCCGNGCMHCPYDYQNVPEPKRSRLLAARHEQENDQRG